jgi:hypothetical protein
VDLPAVCRILKVMFSVVLRAAEAVTEFNPQPKAQAFRERCLHRKTPARSAVGWTHDFLSGEVGTPAVLPTIRFVAAIRSIFLIGPESETEIRNSAMCRNACCLVAALVLSVLGTTLPVIAGDFDSARDVAAQVDQLIAKELAANEVQPAPLATDEDFLRRATLDIAGTLPTPRDVTLFGIDPTGDKREQMVGRLLHSTAYSETWARYWRDVLFSRATNARGGLVNRSFTQWMTDALAGNRGWDEITTDLLTATGDVRFNGDTALLFLQEGSPEDIAGEVSRVFLGIQMQCANCHNHPWNSWQREQFHELAAFFPRVAVRPVQEDGMQRSFEIASVNRDIDPARRQEFLKDSADRLVRFSDRNRDGKLTKDEIQQNQQFARIFDRLLEVADRNKDGGLSAQEIKDAPTPMPNQAGRGSAEHYMVDLSNPASRGTRMEPKFFVTGLSAKSGLEDLERRELIADYITSSNDEWFSKAFVNRMWAELTGQGFYMPIDDLGPERTPSFPAVLDLLADEFVRHDYDIRWLVATIAMTQTYQREIRPDSTDTASVPFASATPTRLRGDQLYSSILKTLGGSDDERRGRGSGMMAGGQRGRFQSPRDQFGQLFGFDPSTPQADITGTVPQALFMMNAQQINSQINANGATRLAALLRKFPDSDDAVSELYLLVLSREPTDKERQIVADYIAEVGNRNEAFEDLMWSLLNSSEFLSKR